MIDRLQSFAKSPLEIQPVKLSFAHPPPSGGISQGIRRRRACPMKFFAEEERSEFNRGEADLTGVVEKNTKIESIPMTMV